VFVALAAVVLCYATAAAQSEDRRPLAKANLPEPELLLPDGRALPELPVYLQGRWNNDDITVTDWEAELDVKGDSFVGKISFPTMRIFVPLTVQGTRSGDVVEFFIRAQNSDVAYFAGHLAGTSLVGTFEGATGQRGNWDGSWFPESLKDNPRRTGAEAD